jgi:hypothetical protein
MSSREIFFSEADVMPDDAFDAYLAMWTVLRKNVKQDFYWSDERRQRVLKSISDFENGITKPVYKTMEELEAYE